MRDGASSCFTCAKAKSKCIRLPGQHACDRCTRLRKECQTREVNTKKRNRKKHTNSTQLQLLDKKIDSLTQALSLQSNQDDRLATEVAQLTPINTPPSLSDDLSIVGQTSHGLHAIAFHSPDRRQQNCVDNETPSFTTLSSHQTQHLLDRYAALMATNMPFVLLPPGPLTTSSFTNSPLLFRAIIAVAHFNDTSTQQTLVSDLIQQITTATYTAGEKSMDVLQALLILCTWYNPHLFQTTSHMTLLHLCMALTTDLAIDRDPATCEMAQIFAAMRSCGIPQPEKVVSDEERRAVLGVFWVSSTIFTSFRKTDCPSWTPWLQTCLDVLKGNGEYALAALVECQRIMHSALLTSQKCDAGALQAELDSAVVNQPFCGDGTRSDILQLHRASASIAIWDSSFATSNLDGIWTCIHILKIYVDGYMSLPVSAYLSVPFTVFAQFAFVFVVMVRASSVHIDGFDGMLLREFLDFEKVMREASERYEGVSWLSVDGVRIQNEGFEKWAQKTRWAQVYYGMQAAKDSTQKDANSGTFEHGGHTSEILYPNRTVWSNSTWNDGGGTLSSYIDFDAGNPDFSSH